MLEICDEKSPDKVYYVSRTRENNGVSAYVRIKDDAAPFDAGLITVAGSGNSVLESFIQYNPFYTGYHVFILKPKYAMSDIEKLFYCFCIRQNQYKYSFGRQANKTLKNILVPKEIPEDFANINLQSLNTIKPGREINKDFDLDTTKWKTFNINMLFDIKGSKTTPLLELEEYGKGEYPYVTTQTSNNGIEGFFDYYTEVGSQSLF